MVPPPLGVGALRKLRTLRIGYAEYGLMAMASNIQL